MSPCVSPCGTSRRSWMRGTRPRSALQHRPQFRADLVRCRLDRIEPRGLVTGIELDLRQLRKIVVARLLRVDLPVAGEHADRALETRARGQQLAGRGTQPGAKVRLEMRTDSIPRLGSMANELDQHGRQVPDLWTRALRRLRRTAPQLACCPSRPAAPPSSATRVCSAGRGQARCRSPSARPPCRRASGTRSPA